MIYVYIYHIYIYIYIYDICVYISYICIYISKLEHARRTPKNDHHSTRHLKKILIPKLTPI